MLGDAKCQGAAAEFPRDIDATRLQLLLREAVPKEYDMLAPAARTTIRSAPRVRSVVPPMPWCAASRSTTLAAKVRSISGIGHISGLS